MTRNNNLDHIQMGIAIYARPQLRSDVFSDRYEEPRYVALEEDIRNVDEEFRTQYQSQVVL